MKSAWPAIVLSLIGLFACGAVVTRARERDESARAEFERTPWIAIARQLVVSLSTVRTHTRNVYAKLGVNNRRAAVTRAGELDLLSRGRRR